MYNKLTIAFLILGSSALIPSALATDITGSANTDPTPVCSVEAPVPVQYCTHGFGVPNQCSWICCPSENSTVGECQNPLN